MFMKGVNFILRWRIKAFSLHRCNTQRSKRVFLKKSVLVLFFLSLWVSASVAFAQDEPGMIQINNGSEIVTNSGQQPQIVVQFGNRGQHALHDVSVYCVWEPELGLLGAVHAGPFTHTGTFFGGEVYYGADLQLNVLVDRITLPPGQNHNVAFNINVHAPAGSEYVMFCALQTNVLEWLAQTPTVRVRVQ